MDRAGEFLTAVEAVQAGTATREQAQDVLAMAELCGRGDLAILARAILDRSRAKSRAA